MIGSLKMIIHHNAFPRIVFHAGDFQPHTLNVRRATDSHQDLINGDHFIFTTAFKVDEFFPILLLNSLDLGFKYQANTIFYEGFLHLSLQRNLQILGAFAFLSQMKGKDFFRQYILPAAYSLAVVLKKFPGNPYPFLARLIGEIIEQLEEENVYRTVII